MNRGLFLDRDGVINEDYGYVHKIKEFHFREGIFDVCRAAQEAKMKIIVVTNQAGIGRGYYTEEDYQTLTTYMTEKFASKHIYITDVYHCPYHPEHGIGHYKRVSFCRKPNPGMLIRACNSHLINPSFSLMIGDKQSDLQASKRSGIPFYIDSNKFDWVESALSVIKKLDPAQASGIN